jgi:hypothetical protein
LKKQRSRHPLQKDIKQYLEDVLAEIGRKRI